ncbi:MAG: hypothetical protein JNL58_04510 [Planctomyces sp.]|nr:hypothetical protein [Planctomyces sp.]
MIPFVAIGPGPDYPAVADVEDGVVYDFGNLEGTLVGGAGGTFPATDDVRNGTVYGPTDNLVGTATEFATPLADLDDANMSAFEDAALQGLETLYDVEGVPADYTTDGETVRITVLVESKQTTLDDSNNQRKEIEVLRCSALASIVTDPKVGDTLTLKASNGTRTYRLTQMPVLSDSHLEWELEFQRSKLMKVGGVKVAPTK